VSLTGLKKCCSVVQGQEEFPSGQVAFHSHLPNGQGSDMSSSVKTFKDKTKTCPGKQNFRTTYPKGKLNFFDP